LLSQANSVTISLTIDQLSHQKANMASSIHSRAERCQQLWRLSALDLLQLYNGVINVSPGTAESRGMPKESMIRSILLTEGYQAPKEDEESTPFRLF
jgi:hypothetical protein